MASGSTGLRLEIERVLSGTTSRVYGFFSEPDRLARWWGPRGFSIPSLEWTPRVGASYRIDMQPPEGDAFHLTGAFQRVDPPVRLAFTFSWEPPDPDDVETLVDLSFRNFGDITEVALVQGPFETEARLELHRGGWGESFDKLEELLVAPWA